MSKKSGNPSFAFRTYESVPKDLSDHPFYGLSLDDNQIFFRDSIWSDGKRIIFCNARAGTGKTTIALGVAYLLYCYKNYDGVIIRLEKFNNWRLE